MKNTRNRLLLVPAILLVGIILGMRGSVAEEPAPAKSPFSADDARCFQQCWARHQGNQVVHTNSIGMKLVFVPPGEFMMGSTDEEVRELIEYAEKAMKHPHWRELWSNWFRTEAKRHRVKITRPFYLGATEVTVGQFRRFVEATGHKVAIERPPTLAARRGKFPQLWIRGKLCSPPSDDCPASSISWTDAVAFCKWLSKKEGREYRLPTEAEWEYACRAGSTTRWFFGDDPEAMSEYIQFGHSSPEKLYLVGQKKPNQFGIYDMLGGVYEWCSDWFAVDYYQHSPVEDPQGPATPKPAYWPVELPTLDPGLDRDPQSRVMRGGAFNFSSPMWFRCAHRIGLGITGGHWHLGFRAAMTVRSGDTPNLKDKK